VIALGGSWSPSLDGLNPQSDPKVLVNTALRCVKAQAGIDLSRVTKWYEIRSDKVLNLDSVILDL